MFTLNEAPNTVLNAINKVKAKQNCFNLTAYLACPFTFGLSFLMADDKTCCCEQVPIPAKMSLGALIDTLNKVKITKNLPKEMLDSLEQEAVKRAVIESQVKQTIRILREAIRQDLIQGSMRTALEDALTKISFKAQQEETFSQVLLTEHTPLTGFDAYVPNYGTRASPGK